MNFKFQPGAWRPVYLALCLLMFPLGLPAQTAASGSDTSASSVVAAASSDSPGSSDGYVLRVNDMVRVAVFQEDDMLTETRVSKSGYITLPLLGPVSVAGKTVGEAVYDIRTRLDKDYIINPHVTLAVLEYAQQWVTVLGEVQKPGQVLIPTEGGLDLLGAIALAGGYTRIADPSRVIVRRTVDGRDTVLRVDAAKLARDAQVEPFLVQPGDRINVAQSVW